MRDLFIFFKVLSSQDLQDRLELEIPGGQEPCLSLLLHIPRTWHTVVLQQVLAK